jgi:hypothetical protein
MIMYDNLITMIDHILAGGRHVLLIANLQSSTSMRGRGAY